MTEAEAPSTPGARRSRRRRALVPALALVVASALLVAWYELWIPWIDVQEPRWLISHSDAEICAELERVVDTWGWSHDASLEVGRCGPEWVERILADAKDFESLDSCAAHFGGSLRSITGQDIDENDLEGWETWYAANKGKTRREWCRDALAAAGLVVPAKLGAEDVYRLLAWMGDRSRETGPPGQAALHLLRDDPVMLEIELHGPTRSLNPVEVMGLRRYTILTADGAFDGGLFMASPPMRLGPPAALCVVIAVSIFLLGRVSRK